MARAIFKHAMALGGLAVSFIVGIAWTYRLEVTTFEKIAQHLMAPAGFVWFLVACLTYVAWFRARVSAALAVSFVFAIYTLAGSDHVGNALVGWLEADFPAIRPTEAKFLDWVVVLGGGAASRSNGCWQLTESGDRVATAARWYHAGKCRWLVTTGSILGIRRTKPAGPAAREDDQATADVAAHLLAELGCDPKRIVQLAGRNTSEEIAEIARFQREHPDESIGIVTSAWHMRRVTRLAAPLGLSFTPIPCDHECETRALAFFPIPTYHGFRKNERFCKEWIAVALGR